MKRVLLKAWQLNERHYSAFTGLNKIEMGKKLVKKESINLGDLGI